MTAWCTGRWWCCDCLLLFRGGMGMAQRFSAWPPRDKLLPEQQGRAITVLAGGLATPIQPRRMYNKIQAGPAGKLHTGPNSKETDTFLFFSLYTSHWEGIYNFYVKKKKTRAKAGQTDSWAEQDSSLLPAAFFLGVSLTVYPRWRRCTTKFPSYWDNLNDNVICHFVWKVI